MKAELEKAEIAFKAEKEKVKIKAEKMKAKTEIDREKRALKRRATEKIAEFGERVLFYVPKKRRRKLEPTYSTRSVRTV